MTRKPMDNEMFRRWKRATVGALVARDDATYQQTMNAMRDKAAQVARGPKSAAARKARFEERDAAIAEMALRLIANSEELAGNSKKLMSAILDRWRPNWGLPISTSRLASILSERGVTRRRK